LERGVYSIESWGAVGDITFIAGKQIKNFGSEVSTW
jgi:hypothetical protein